MGGGAGPPVAKKVCRRSTVGEGSRPTSAAATRGEITAGQTADELFNGLDDDNGDCLTDTLDMSWSTILGRSLSCPDQLALPVDNAPQNDPESRPPVVDVAAVSGGSGSRSDVDNDAELDELIRACADTDPGVLDDLGDFDSLDLTVYGVGLRPPDWWSSLGDSFGSAAGSAASAGDEATARRQGLNTPSPTPDAQEVRMTREQTPLHPWAEHRGSSTMPTSLDSSLDAICLLPGGPQTPFDSDVDDF